MSQVCKDNIGCIVGAVVHLAPQGKNNQLIRKRLSQLEGVDIHIEDKHLRLVITIETASIREAMALTERIQNFDGVMQITLVYQHCDEALNHEQEGGWTWR